MVTLFFFSKKLQCVIYSFLQWKCLTWWLSAVKVNQFQNGMHIEGKWSSICAVQTCLKSLRELFYLPFTLQENSIKASQIWEYTGAYIYICTDKPIKIATETAISYSQVNMFHHYQIISLRSEHMTVWWKCFYFTSCSNLINIIQLFDQLMKMFLFFSHLF